MALSDFDIQVLTEITHFKENSGWMATALIALAFGEEEEYEEPVKESTLKLLSLKYIKGPGDPDPDGTYDAYSITPPGKQFLRERTSNQPIFKNKTQASFKDGNINICLQKAIFDHVQELLNDGYYFNAVEEAYKIVRQKLKDITGREKATDAFCTENYEKIFGHQPKNDAEKDFFEGVKFLHMAVQFLRNEKAHTPAGQIDKNLAIHYISLASLAYDLITRK